MLLKYFSFFINKQLVKILKSLMIVFIIVSCFSVKILVYLSYQFLEEINYG